MERLYHSLDASFSQAARVFHKKKKVVFTLVFIFLLGVLFFRPLLPYLPLTFKLGKDFVTSSPKDLRSHDGRTNFLTLGLGGPKNEPSGLTDTIIFASISHRGEDSLLLSLPRDIWIPEMQAKLNTAYYYGNLAEGLGLEWARDFVSGITGQPIHYVIVVSFDGFVETVDILGGVDVFIQRGFVDERYPIPGRENDPCDGDSEVRCRFETVGFEGGWQHLSGEQALKFARSRNAEGPEGTDFARSIRQQKIISAIKKKVLSLKTLLNPEKLSKLLKVAQNSIESDVPESHLGALAKLALQTRKAGLRSEVLNGVYSGSENPGLLFNPPVSEKYNFQWVLVPQGNSWESAQEWVSCILEGGGCAVEEFIPKESPRRR